jgi:hypothetical protein
MRAAAVLLALAGCASNRSVLSMSVRPLEAADARIVEIEGAALRVPWNGGSGGISGPSSSFLEIELDDRYGDGCAAGRISRKLEPVSEIRERTMTVKLCPRAPRERGWKRWHGDAVRRHPELLATVVVTGFVPRSSSDRYELVP